MDVRRFEAELTDFADTAALMQSLDLVISVDTAIAHLAGALGRPVWILLSSPAEWRWLRGRDDSPWYPSARLFRQSVPGEWSEVLTALQAALQAALRVLP
jgi:ADP-heptose:LPS heptosyltransferase